MIFINNDHVAIVNKFFSSIVRKQFVDNYLTKRYYVIVLIYFQIID